MNRMVAIFTSNNENNNKPNKEHKFLCHPRFNIEIAIFRAFEALPELMS